MELRHIYQIANAINEKIDNSENLKDINVTVKVSSTTHYGIDKEFYRLTNGSTDGFKHSDEITAVIDGIEFTILDKDKIKTSTD